jgi:putative ATPase
MAKLDYSKGYKYAHDFDNNFIDQQFLPDQLTDIKFYEPGENAAEEKLNSFLKARWTTKYGK